MGASEDIEGKSVYTYIYKYRMYICIYSISVYICIYIYIYTQIQSRARQVRAVKGNINSTRRKLLINVRLKQNKNTFLFVFKNNATDEKRLRIRYSTRNSIFFISKCRKKYIETNSSEIEIFCLGYTNPEDILQILCDM